MLVALNTEGMPLVIAGLALLLLLSVLAVVLFVGSGRPHS